MFRFEIYDTNERPFYTEKILEINNEMVEIKAAIQGLQGAQASPEENEKNKAKIAALEKRMQALEKVRLKEEVKLKEQKAKLIPKYV